jgi:sirohydrochlorin cobaltochelatase
MVTRTPIHDAALLLLGHGSTLNADSSAPTHQHAEELRRRGVFAEVHVAFWKEEPNFRQALRQTRRRQVYVVPNFISSGYFTEQIIPRELGLGGPVTHIGEQDVFYCQPVGLHPVMKEALLRRAQSVVAASTETIPEPSKTACLFICGHGTSLNDNSTKIIHEQAGLIRALGLYADCQAVLMEQAPFVKEWRALTACPDVIVVPFFISDGLHSYEDIPVLLGLTHNIREKGFTNPHRENGRRLWYATAIGTEPFLADTILSQVEAFQSEHPEATQTAAPAQLLPTIGDELARFLEEMPPPWRIGDVAIRAGEGASLELVHHSDLATPGADLDPVGSLEQLRELVMRDWEGHFRPLRAAPNLARGWVHREKDAPGLQLALEYLHPAALANWALWRQKRLPVTPWRETAERQSGRFRVVREVDDPGVGELVAAHCKRGCLKQRLWSPAEQTVRTHPGEIPLLCPEACNFLVGKAREKVKGPGEDEAGS